VHDCDNDNVAIENPEKNAKWKDFGQAAPDVKINDRIETRVNGDAIDGVLNSGKESLTEILLLTLIIRCRRNHFRLGEGMKSDLRHVSFA